MQDEYRMSLMSNALTTISTIVADDRLTDQAKLIAIRAVLPAIGLAVRL